MMKFEVRIGYRCEFLFDSADEAMRFAITAKCKGSRTDSISVELLDDEELIKEGEEDV